MNHGEVESFSTKPFLEAAELLARADEPERALQLLHNLPAFYRDHTPKEVAELRAQIQQSLLTPNAYASVDFDSDVSVEKSVALLDGLLRGRKVKDTLEKLASDGKVPHIIDMGPGEYWLPIGLHRLGYFFSYNDISLLGRTAKQAREILPAEVFRKEPQTSQPIIFVAFELIEHLLDPRELAIEAFRHAGRQPDYIFLSTPLYTYDARADKEWKGRDKQPHLRAYTPTEFLVSANELFPGYHWELEADQIMVLKGTRNG